MRFVEDIEANINPDFFPRAYMRPLSKAILFYVATLSPVMIALLGDNYLSLSVAALISLVAITLSAGYLYWQLQQNDDLLMANDFQNLLFSAASSLSSSFSFYLKRDGTIVYANEGTRKMFPKFVYEESRALDALLHSAKVSKEDRARIYSALTRGKKENLVFSFEDEKAQTQQFILIMEPLPRPAGYFVVHGRPYYSNRTSKANLPGVLSRTSAEKLEVLLQNMPIAAYATNETGIIEFANSSLENLLRYDSGKLSQGTITAQRMIYHADGVETGEFELNEYAGTVLLNAAHGSMVQGYLQQMRYLNEDGDYRGVIGFITPMK